MRVQTLGCYRFAGAIYSERHGYDLIPTGIYFPLAFLFGGPETHVFEHNDTDSNEAVVPVEIATTGDSELRVIAGPFHYRGDLHK